jgi:phosphoribosylformimino-5-aminoimidazole carboxamide ribotide isomerase
MDSKQRSKQRIVQFRPCIDLHEGKVKQIVGGTLSDADAGALRTNFEASRPAQWYAALYRRDGLAGGHVIQLGPGNRAAAEAALDAWPGGLQIGGGITIDNAEAWIDRGAAAVIVTSWIFQDGMVHEDRLKRLSRRIGPRRLVLDLSCRRRGGGYFIVTDRWQTFTHERVTSRLLDRLSAYCCEYLVHGVDVEGRCRGIETPLVQLLGDWGKLPVTYAGGISSLDDIQIVERVGGGRVDFTVGSALDLFGGRGLAYEDLVKGYAARR